MRKSKHFRKDVIIARIIAAIILIILIVIIHSLVSLMFKPSANKDKNTQNIESEYDSDGDLNHSDTEGNTEADVTIENTSNSEDIKVYVITTANVKLRSGPSTNDTVIGGINKDEKALLLEEIEGWYKISYNGQEGYISADYSKIVE